MYIIAQKDVVVAEELRLKMMTAVKEHEAIRGTSSKQEAASLVLNQEEAVESLALSQEEAVPSAPKQEETTQGTPFGAWLSPQ